MTNYKYKIGDKVRYLDCNKQEKEGMIRERLRTNDESRNLYIVWGYGYLRYEEEILEKTDY